MTKKEKRYRICKEVSTVAGQISSEVFFDNTDNSKIADLVILIKNVMYHLKYDELDEAVKYLPYWDLERSSVIQREMKNYQE